LGCDEPFKTGCPVIEANVDCVKPTPPVVLEPVKNTREAIRESVKIIGGVDGSCNQGEEGEKEKGSGEEKAKGEGVFVRSAGREEAGSDFMKSTEAE
jgi:hypothetical protein